MSEGRTWLITGANRGIGLHLTREILAQKREDRVVACAREPERAEALHEAAKQHRGRLELLRLDVSSDASAKEAGLAFDLLFDGGPLDILVNNAGVLLEYDLGLESLDLAQVETMFSVNSLGPMRVSRTFMKALKRSSRPVIAQVSSDLGSISQNEIGMAYGYRMSKTALNMFNKTLSIAEPSLVCVTLHPGWVATDMGGGEAPLEPAESAAGLFRVICGLELSDSGRYLDHRGEEHAW